MRRICHNIIRALRSRARPWNCRSKMGLLLIPLTISAVVLLLSSVLLSRSSSYSPRCSETHDIYLFNQSHGAAHLAAQWHEEWKAIPARMTHHRLKHTNALHLLWQRSYPARTRTSERAMTLRGKIVPTSEHGTDPPAQAEARSGTFIDGQRARAPDALPPAQV